MAKYQVQRWGHQQRWVDHGPLAEHPTDVLDTLQGLVGPLDSERYQSAWHAMDEGQAVGLTTFASSTGLQARIVRASR